MRAGFIGYSGFARKLEYHFKSLIPGLEILFYHPTKELSGRLFTNILNELFSCDFIVIASPDRTHCDYIKKLKAFSGYVFCEKIPAIDSRQLRFLESHKNKRLYFDFNYRKSILFDTLKKNKDKLLYMNQIYSIGLALKTNYHLNWKWRADRKITPLGVFQTSGIHILDLLLYVFGNPLSYHYHSTNLSPYGSSVDNFYLSMVFNTRNKFKADLYFSYTAPFNERIELVTAENLIKITDKKLEIRGPREYYKNGLFALPPVIKSKKINIYDDSLRKSVNYFVEIMKKRQGFTHNYDGNRFFLKLQKEITE